MDIYSIYYKFKFFFVYGAFGLLTTLLNLVVYWCCFSKLSISNIISTTIAWVVAILFAFITNKIYVFEGMNCSIANIMIEFSKFIIGRITTGVLEIGLMYTLVDLIAFNAVTSKIFVNVIVIILNYVFSRFVVWKKD